MLDITKRVQVHLEAQRQARILQVLAAASSRLIQAEQFERAVLDTLADICTLTQAKRVAVILWQNDGITPLQSFSYSPRNGVSTVDIAELNAASMLRFEWNVHIAPQGFLGVEKDPLTPLWNEEMHAFLQTIAQTLGSAFQQRYLLQTMEQRVKSRTRELNALYELASMTSETLDAHTILQIGLEVLFNVFDRCKGAAFLLDPHLHSLQLTAYKGWQRDKSGEVIYRHLKRFAQKVHNHRGPLLMTQKPIRKKVHNQPLSVQQNFLGITLFSQEHSWGCLCVMAEGHNPFSPEDVALLSAVADQLNRAYERATLQLQFRRMAVNEERQRLGRELHDTVTQGVYSLSLLTSAAQQAMKAGKCTHVERYLEMMEKHTYQILKEMRLFIYELRPDVFFKKALLKRLPAAWN
jgi:signal transduction histidine kinase